MSVDEQTEIFTDRGWSKYDQVRVGDRALTIEPKTGATQWQVITDLYIGIDNDRELVSIETYWISALTTPDHRWLVKESPQSRSWHWTTSEALTQGDWIPYMHPEAWAFIPIKDMGPGQDSDEFTLPSPPRRWVRTFVWCPRLKNGNWLARRNRRMYYTGEWTDV